MATLHKVSFVTSLFFFPSPHVYRYSLAQLGGPFSYLSWFASLNEFLMTMVFYWLRCLASALAFMLSDFIMMIIIPMKIVYKAILKSTPVIQVAGPPRLDLENFQSFVPGLTCSKNKPQAAGKPEDPQRMLSPPEHQTTLSQAQPLTDSPIRFATRLASRATTLELKDAREKPCTINSKV